MTRSLTALPLVGACLAGLGIRAAEPADSGAVAFFEKNVRPVLVRRCVGCHGPEKQKGGLRLDSRAAVLAGGDRGPAVKPGRPGESLLVSAINHGDVVQMPPKVRLPAGEISALTAWVRMGAPWPEDLPAATAAAPPEGKDFWAFRPAVAPPVPAVRDTAWPRSPLDRFILAKLEEKGLRPAPPADRRTLLRRVTFDLTGLPPTPPEIDAFLADRSPDAFARVVDRLLASPAYGERWGRHWLDVARYADSNGMDENLVYGNAWRYRDHVIAAFNRDQPYDQFVREQVAGDLLPAADPATTAERLVATGFLAIGPKMLAEDDPAKMQMDIVDEQIDTVGRTFLGLTLGCARCHDHKFDPISAADYYGLAGIFKSTRTMDTFTVVARWHERPVAPARDVERQRAYDRELAAKRAAIDRLAKEAEKRPAGTGAAKPPANPTARLQKLRAELTALEKARPVLPEAMAVEEGTAGNVRIHLRGSHWTLGREVPRRFPAVLAGPDPPAVGSRESGRLQLARWLTRPDHPLTARVMVNRVWHWHFGGGLVRSPDNFGKLGDRPVNQPLLDWLAVQFVRGGWSVKALHRLICLSSTYQAGSAYDARAVLVDPDNRLHWRWSRRRLEAEAVRDALLAVSGRLDRRMGGSLLRGENRKYVPGYPNSDYNQYDFDRRSVYLPVLRSELYQVLQAFDFADPSVPNGERAVTTVPSQALFMMNSKPVREATRHLAAGLLADPARDDAGRVRAVYERALGRPPDARETARALDFVRRFEAALADAAPPGERRLRAWQSLCRAVVASNEFLYVE